MKALVLLLMLHSAFFLQASSIKYYSSLQFMESPFQNFKGIVPLNKEQAMKRNHYRFEYDDKERLTKVSFFLGDKLRNPNFTANYFFLSPIIKIDYEQNKEIRTFYDRFEAQIPVRGSVFKEIYELDENGNRTKLHFENRNGEKVQSAWNMSDYNWQINTDGTVIEKRFNLNTEPVPMRPDLLFYTVKFIFDEKDHLTLMQNINDDGSFLENASGAAQDKLEYDNNGAFSGWTVLDKNNQLREGNAPNVAQGRNTTNAYGYYQKTVFYDRNLKPMVSAYGYAGNSLEFDTFGNIILHTFLDEYGNPGPHPREGLVYIKYTYDGSGFNLIRTEFLDIHKKTFTHPLAGYASQTDYYDSRNRLIRTDYLDSNGKKSNRNDNGIASVLRELDDQNRMTKLTFLDSEGQLVNQLGVGFAMLTIVFDDEKSTTEVKRFDKDGKELM